MKAFSSIIALLFIMGACTPRAAKTVVDNTPDTLKDVKIITSLGEITVRLSDSTPLHRDNFIKLIKQGFYDSLLFHRVIRDFMIQFGDPQSKNAAPGIPLGNGDVGYKIPSEFRTSLFHKRGVLSAAHDGNPQKSSSGCQFFIVQGRIYTDESLDSVETFRLMRKIPAELRAAYKVYGGAAHLDGNYTVFGEVISGIEIVDLIGDQPTSRNPPNRPLLDIRILKIMLVKRKPEPVIQLISN